MVTKGNASMSNICAMILKGVSNSKEQSSQKLVQLQRIILAVVRNCALGLVYRPEMMKVLEK
jgi:hypothetical protein